MISQYFLESTADDQNGFAQIWHVLRMCCQWWTRGGKIHSIVSLRTWSVHMIFQEKFVTLRSIQHTNTLLSY